MKSLIIGGVKSGKSRYAENMLSAFIQSKQLDEKQACLIATAQALDEGMSDRIVKHKQQRSVLWQLIEEPINLAGAIKKAEQTASIILIDCLTLWLTNLLMKEDEAFLQAEINKFLLAVTKCSSELVLVSNETNMGIMPLGQLTRDYCDRSGTLHQSLSEICDSVSLIVAGLPLPLKSPIEKA
jgi:adenosylcobinamide kinase/adenosylcobinamide-phosphate guanylyltransferase